MKKYYINAQNEVIAYELIEYRDANDQIFSSSEMNPWLLLDPDYSEIDEKTALEIIDKNTNKPIGGSDENKKLLEDDLIERQNRLQDASGKLITLGFTDDEALALTGVLPNVP